MLCSLQQLRNCFYGYKTEKYELRRMDTLFVSRMCTCTLKPGRKESVFIFLTDYAIYLSGWHGKGDVHQEKGHLNISEGNIKYAKK